MRDDVAGEWQEWHEWHEWADKLERSRISDDLGRPFSPATAAIRPRLHLGDVVIAPVVLYGRRL